ncbi:Myb DNA-bind 5 domain-containing protein [Aphis craccivora]|uniref:Myb DNA-bind 5 domain-containing protein n=1 Tax=Aphis craccivora TaxID=307492 RepID=A0A6G0YBJ2_APHCR|nr:Myb DNA-bind 5 domain-containing protein [Aphis craccivora]
MKVTDEMGLQNNEYNNLMVEVLQDCQENNSEDLDNITEINWSDYTPAKLRTLISSILSSTIISQNHSCIDHTTNLYEDI